MSDDRCNTTQAFRDELARLEAAETEFEEAQARFYESIRTSVASDDRSGVAYLYWHTLRPLKELGVIIGVTPPMFHAEFAASAPQLGFRCEACSFDFAVAKRSRKSLAPRLCVDCEMKADRHKSLASAESNQASRRQEHEELEHTRALQAMSLADYLQTEHWLRLRQKALECFGFRCDFCSASGAVYVHPPQVHERGRVHFQDLDVMCSGCREGFGLTVGTEAPQTSSEERD